MTGWRFSGADLLVLRDPKPGHSHGQRKLLPEPPGYDGISGVIHDGKFAPRYSLSVCARNYVEYVLLYALFESPTEGDFEVYFREVDDWWVFATACLEGKAEWSKEPDGSQVARVTVVCPDPHPRWKSTGELVF